MIFIATKKSNASSLITCLCDSNVVIFELLAFIQLRTTPIFKEPKLIFVANNEVFYIYF